AGAVGRGRRALGRRAITVFGGHATEGALIDAPVLGAAEGHAVVLELVDRLRRVAAQIFNGVLIAQPIGPLDGVVHVPAPIVRTHVAERGCDAALSGNRVRAGRKHLANAGGLQAGGSAAGRRPQAGATGADDDDVVDVVGEGIGFAIERRLGDAVAFFAVVLGHRSGSKAQLQHRIGAG